MAFPGFKIGDAVAFAVANGLQAKADEIRSKMVRSSIRQPMPVRKGYFVDLFEQAGLFDEFAAQYWPALRTEAGQRRRQTYLTRKALNEQLLAGEPSDAESAEESGLQALDTSETTFGLERDLQLALRGNLEQLEPGLRIIDGGKAQVTAAGRIDITAEDRTGTKVLIELKAGVAAPEALTQLLAYHRCPLKPGAAAIAILCPLTPGLAHALLALPSDLGSRGSPNDSHTRGKIPTGAVGPPSSISCVAGNANPLCAKRATAGP